MGKTFIAMIIIFVILGLVYYFFFYSPAPIETAPAGTTGEIAIDETGATATATDAEIATTEIAGEIGAADNLEVPGVGE